MSLFFGAILTCSGCPDDEIRGPSERQVRTIAHRDGWITGNGRTWYDDLCPKCAATEAARVADIKQEVAS